MWPFQHVRSTHTFQPLDLKTPPQWFRYAVLIVDRRTMSSLGRRVHGFRCPIVGVPVVVVGPQKRHQSGPAEINVVPFGPSVSMHIWNPHLACPFISSSSSGPRLRACCSWLRDVFDARMMVNSNSSAVLFHPRSPPCASSYDERMHSHVRCSFGTATHISIGVLNASPNASGTEITPCPRLDSAHQWVMHRTVDLKSIVHRLGRRRCSVIRRTRTTSTRSTAISTCFPGWRRCGRSSPTGRYI